MVQPVSTVLDLTLLAAGQPVPMWSWGKFFKGVLEVVAGAAAGVAAIVGDGPGLAIGAGIVSAVIGLGLGVDDMVEGAKAPSTGDCPGKAPACKADADCGAGAECSYNCCVKTVGGNSGALIEAGWLNCLADRDCQVGYNCEEACCQPASGPN